MCARDAASSKLSEGVWAEVWWQVRKLCRIKVSPTGFGRWGRGGAEGGRERERGGSRPRKQETQSRYIPSALCGTLADRNSLCPRAERLRLLRKLTYRGRRGSVIITIRDSVSNDSLSRSRGGCGEFYPQRKRPGRSGRITIGTRADTRVNHACTRESLYFCICETTTPSVHSVLLRGV